MISFLGQLCLGCALIFALAQTCLPLLGFWRHNPYLLASARSLAWGQFFFVIIAYSLLTYAFYADDFTILYVAANSHPSLPLLYKLAAVWGAHEGSILLWILMLNGWAFIFSIILRQHVLYELTLAILGLISFSFLLFLIFTSNPFIATNTIIAARDLNPLLQDPGFIIHPPMLYAGYVGFSVAFAITQAALLRGQLNHTWFTLTRQFTIAAWCFLTLGITLGSWWAYRVLGWGGFWFWDPVENASLLPWLSGTALIHVLVLAEKRNLAKNWAALLAVISFALSLLGTFLVRSGVLISAHSFANDPARGIFLLLLFGMFVTAALSIFAMRTRETSSDTHVVFTWLSRETLLLMNSSFLLVAMLTILLGTLYPLILDALHLGIISVGAPYFNKVMLPLVLLMLVVMGIAPRCHWEKNSLPQLSKEIAKNVSLSTLMTIVLSITVVESFDIITIITLFLCILIILNSIYFRLLPGMSFAHLGFAILIIGIVLSSFLNVTREVRIKPGDATNIGPYQFFFLNTQSVTGANYHGVEGIFAVMKQKHFIATLRPEKRIYQVRETIMTKVAIEPGIFRDLYIALGEPLEENFWSVRIYYKPFMRWIWFGGGIMILGGFLALWQRNRAMRLI